MIFFFDVGFFIIAALIVGGGIVGGIASWILDHLLLVLILLLAKSLLIFSGTGLFGKKENAAHAVLSAAVLLLDLGRNILFLYSIAQTLGGMFSGGLFQFVLGIIGALFGGGLLFLASEGPMYLVYDWGVQGEEGARFAILFEAVSIIATFLVAWWGGVF